MPDITPTLSYKDFSTRQYRLVVGIDAGRHTGWAAWDPRTELLFDVHTTTFWGAYMNAEAMQQGYDPADVLFVIEDPSQNRPVFPERFRGPGKDKEAVRLKIAQDVGGVKRESILLIAGIAALGFTVKAVRPHTSKWDAETFTKRTGLTLQTSEHSRDAAQLVFKPTRVRTR